MTLALAGGSLTLSHPAVAEVSIGIGGGGIAFGYNDGYWDREHNWHRWRNRAEARRWRAENREHYFGWRHDRDRDLGWREERWWDRH
jgi:hypothetical protein